MTIPRWLLTTTIILAGAACSVEAPAGPVLQDNSGFPAASTHPAGDDVVRVPFKLTGQGIGTEGAAEPACDEGFFPTGNEAHGTATHLGQFTSFHRQCVNFETLEFRDGTVTYHAADGDQLHATFEGFLSPTDEPGVLSFDNPAYPVGGTGRFEGADGLFQARGLVDLNDDTFELRVEGYLLLPK